MMTSIAESDNVVMDAEVSTNILRGCDALAQSAVATTGGSNQSAADASNTRHGERAMGMGKLRRRDLP